MSNDETQPLSGSSSEQPEQPEYGPGPQPLPQAVTQPIPGPAYAPAPQPRKRGKLLLAVGAVGVALVAGAAGFALGQANADNGREGPGRFGLMENGGGPMHGQEGGPPGAFPGQGQPPGFPDGDGEENDNDQLPGGGASEAPPTS